MASVCGASLALMDAGIPIKGAVAGIAMGLVKEGDDYAILTDIAGAEDHYGDMDFKVAGTREGITALQMDIKIGGITTTIMREAMEQARRGRLYLLDIMDEALSATREVKSKHAPQIRTLQIPVDKIRDLIGPGGKMIRSIIEATQVKIDVDDTGRVNVASSDADGLQKALEMISNLTAVPEVGKTYLGKVVRLAEFGAFVELFPGTDGLLHVSEIAEHRVKEVKDELKEGDQVMVKVLGIEGNRIKLSRKALLKEQREKLGLPLATEGAPARPERALRPERVERAEPVERQPLSNASTITIEGGEEFDEEYDGTDDGEEGDEPNFNVDPAAVPVGAGGAPSAGGPNSQQRRRRRGRGRMGGGGGGRGPGGPR
jgi:polyribonucleotide nucleotidyltransferase